MGIGLVGIQKLRSDLYGGDIPGQDFYCLNVIPGDDTYPPCNATETESCPSVTKMIDVASPSPVEYHPDNQLGLDQTPSYKVP